jgi:hypothetical protein
MEPKVKVQPNSLAEALAESVPVQCGVPGAATHPPPPLTLRPRTSPQELQKLLVDTVGQALALASQDLE